MRLPLARAVLLLAVWQLGCLASARRDLSLAAPAAAVNGAAAAPAPPAAEAVSYPESKWGSPRMDACVEVADSAWHWCSVESDTVSLVYPRGSEQLPNPEQVSTAITNMKAAAQPSSACCDAMLPYVQSRCPCDPDFQQLLSLQGLDVAYAEGSPAIVAQACGQSFPPCNSAGEVSQPQLPGSGGR